MSWFSIDKSGLAAILERRGKSFAAFELVQNAWDSGAAAVSITLTPIEGQPYATLAVEDDSPEGWADLDHAYTMFARSRRAGDAEKRGRFNLGEKLVLAISRRAVLSTMAGTIIFDDGGRRRSSERRERGTRIECEVRMNRSELATALADIAMLIPPVPTTLNGERIERPKLLATFTAKLPTEVADVDGNLRRLMRETTIEAYEADGTGDVCELGVPVTFADWPWRLNVLQKVPLNLERDGVTEQFRRALQVAAVNAMSERIEPEQASQPWVQEAIGDSRAVPQAVKSVIVKQFGDRAVVATPGDPLANATAEAQGYTVVHGGSLSADVWANVRKHEAMVSAASAFPTIKPEDRAKAIDAMGETCPLCGQALRKAGGQ